MKYQNLILILILTYPFSFLFSQGEILDQTKNLNDSSFQEMYKLDVEQTENDFSHLDKTIINTRGFGDRYLTTQLNGINISGINLYKNGLFPDMIPSNSLSEIIVSKSFTPDKPGHFSGVNANLKTISFPKERKFSFSISTGFNTQSSFQNDFLTFEGGKTDWIGYDDGSRELPSQFTDEDYSRALRNSSFIIARSDNELAGQIEELYDLLNQQFEPTMKTSPMNYGMGVSYTNQFSFEKNMKLGVNFSANHQKTFQHYDGALRNHVLFGDFPPSLGQAYDWNGTTSIESPTTQGFLGLSLLLNQKNIISYYTNYFHVAEKSTKFFQGDAFVFGIVGSDNQFQLRELYWKERITQNKIITGRHQIKKNIEIEWGAKISKNLQEEPDLRYFSSETGMNNNAASWTSEYNSPEHFFRTLNEKQYEGTIDITIPLNQSTFLKESKLKIGSTISLKDRIFNESNYGVENSFGEEYEGNAEMHFSDENGGWIGVHPSGINLIGLYLVDISQPSNNYHGSEEIFASYGLFEFNNIGNFSIALGARYENSRQPIESSDQSFNLKNKSILPSLSVQYDLINNIDSREKMSIIGTANKTLARPNLRELSSYSYFDFTTGAMMVGNPNLKMTSISNFDLKWEWQKKERDLLTFSVFYKKFDDPLILVNQVNFHLEFKFENDVSAFLYGAEFEFQKGLEFISPRLKNLLWVSNFSLVYSETVHSDLSLLPILNIENPTNRLFNQSPYEINSSLIYSNIEKELDAGISFSVLGKRFIAIGDGDVFDIYENPRPQLDFTISKKIFKEKMSIIFAAKNLLNPKYQLKSSLFDNEFVFSEYRIGRTFSMSFIYEID